MNFVSKTNIFDFLGVVWENESKLSLKNVGLTLLLRSLGLEAKKPK
jgi:hypothetical protein